MWKGSGMVREIFRTRNMRNLTGNVGIAHVRYPTAGSAFSVEEAQPFYVNAPFGITLGHNGNLTNAEQLKSEMFRIDRRHINTNSDSEILLNVLAHELQEGTSSYTLDPATIFRAVAALHDGARRIRVRCAYRRSRHRRVSRPVRNPAHGLRRNETDAGTEYLVARIGRAREAGFKFVRDVAPATLFIDIDGNFYRSSAPEADAESMPLRYVYFARPDSVMNGVRSTARSEKGEYSGREDPQQVRTGASTS